MEGNICFNASVKINPDSEKFLVELGSLPFSRMIDKYDKVPLLEQIKYFVKQKIRKVN